MRTGNEILIQKLANGFNVVLPFIQDYNYEADLRYQTNIVKDEFTKDEALSAVKNSTAKKKELEPFKMTGNENIYTFKKYSEALEFLKFIVDEE